MFLPKKKELVFPEALKIILVKICQELQFILGIEKEEKENRCI